MFFLNIVKADYLNILNAQIAEELKYKVELCPAEGAVTVTDGNIRVMVSLTSPVMREPSGELILSFLNESIFDTPISLSTKNCLSYDTL